jgi:hypothetical protein
MVNGEIISALVGAVIGAAIGGAITYYSSTKLLGIQLKTQQAYEFVTKNYLPLLHAIEEYKFNLDMWTRIGTKKEEDKLYSREEALQLCSEAFELLKEEIEKLTRSGMSLIISKIDKELAARILVLNTT